LIDTIKSVEQNYKWIIYRLCFESYQNKNEIINTETADQNILDSDVPFFTYKLLTEWFGFEARQIRIIRTHAPNSPERQIQLFGYLGHTNNQTPKCTRI
jgi:hypothetical protein